MGLCNKYLKKEETEMEDSYINWLYWNDPYLLIPVKIEIENELIFLN